MERASTGGLRPENTRQYYLSPCLVPESWTNGVDHNRQKPEDTLKFMHKLCDFRDQATQSLGVDSFPFHSGIRAWFVSAARLGVS